MLGFLFLVLSNVSSATELNISVKGTDHVERAAVGYFLKGMSQKPLSIEPVVIFEKDILGAKLIGTFEDATVVLKSPSVCPTCTNLKIAAGNLFKMQLNEPNAILQGKIRIALQTSRKTRTLFLKGFEASGVEALASTIVSALNGSAQLDQFEITGAKISAVTIQDPGKLQKIFDRLIPGMTVDRIVTFAVNKVLERLTSNDQLKKTIVDSINKQLIEMAQTILKLDQVGLSANIQIASIQTLDNEIKTGFDVNLQTLGAAKPCRTEDVFSDPDVDPSSWAAAPLATSVSPQTDFESVIPMALPQTAFKMLSKQGVICIEGNANWQSYGLIFSVRPRGPFQLEIDPSDSSLWTAKVPVAGRIFPRPGSPVAISSTLGTSNIFLHYALKIQNGNQLSLKFNSVGLSRIYGTAYIGRLPIPLSTFSSPILNGILSALGNGVGDLKILNGSERFFESLKVGQIETPTLQNDAINLKFSVLDEKRLP